MSRTVGDLFWERLAAWGVKRVFGYPGAGINGLLGALQRRGGDIPFVPGRQQETGGFLASAHAKLTGNNGVCPATSDAGPSHVMSRKVQGVRKGQAATVGEQ